MSTNSVPSETVPTTPPLGYRNNVLWTRELITRYCDTVIPCHHHADNDAFRNVGNQCLSIGTCFWMALLSITRPWEIPKLNAIGKILGWSPGVSLYQALRAFSIVKSKALIGHNKKKNGDITWVYGIGGGRGLLYVKKGASAHWVPFLAVVDNATPPLGGGLSSQGSESSVCSSLPFLPPLETSDTRRWVLVGTVEPTDSTTSSSSMSTPVSPTSFSSSSTAVVVAGGPARRAHHRQPPPVPPGGPPPVTVPVVQAEVAPRAYHIHGTRALPAEPALIATCSGTLARTEGQSEFLFGDTSGLQRVVGKVSGSCRYLELSMASVGQQVSENDRFYVKTAPYGLQETVTLSGCFDPSAVDYIACKDCNFRLVPVNGHYDRDGISYSVFALERCAATVFGRFKFGIFGRFVDTEVVDIKLKPTKERPVLTADIIAPNEDCKYRAAYNMYKALLPDELHGIYRDMLNEEFGMDKRSGVEPFEIAQSLLSRYTDIRAWGSTPGFGLH